MSSDNPRCDKHTEHALGAEYVGRFWTEPYKGGEGEWEPCPHDPYKPSNMFRREIEAAINKYSRESGSGTPDFILAEYLTDCLDAFDKAVQARAHWRGTNA